MSEQQACSSMTAEDTAMEAPTEIEQQRERRRAQDRARRRERLASESAEEREARLSRRRAQDRVRRATQSSQDRQQRERELAQDRARRRERLASESAAEREARLSRRRAQDRVRRATQSSQNRQAHLQQVRCATSFQRGERCLRSGSYICREVIYAYSRHHERLDRSRSPKMLSIHLVLLHAMCTLMLILVNKVGRSLLLKLFTQCAHLC